MCDKLHRNPPFRAEHLGSLLRPKELLEVKTAWEQGKASKEELTAIENTSIDEAVKKQLDLGFHAVTDGEYRRHMFWGTFFPGLDGFEEISNPDIDMFRMYVPDVVVFTEAGDNPIGSVICTGKIKHVRSTYIDQWNYLKSILPQDRIPEAKLTLAAPTWYHLRYKTGRAYPKNVYANDEAYFADIAQAYRDELKILYAAGLRNVQFDDPNFAYFCSEKMLAGFEVDGEDAIALFDKYVNLYNDCLSERPSDLHVGIHLCRGNFANSRHFSEGGYDAIATKFFKDLNVDTFYLEYDTPRAGGFEPLKELPAHKNVILGLVTSKFATMEHFGRMTEKVYAAADMIALGGGSKEEALNRLGISPQCGFASHADGNLVTSHGMENKLKLVRRLANTIWPGQS